MAVSFRAGLFFRRRRELTTMLNSDSASGADVGKFFKTPGHHQQADREAARCRHKVYKERILMIPPIFFTPATPPRRDSF
jgi:hypothetical protein